MSTLLLALTALAQAADRTCYDIEYVEIPEWTDGCFYGLNDALVFTGNYCTPGCASIRGYVYDYPTATYETFGVDGYQIVGWSKINNAGVVAFEAYNEDGTMAGFTRSPDGTIEPLPFPGEGDPTPYSAVGINNVGTIVGYVWDDAEGRNRGVIWDGDSYTVMDGPGPGDNYFLDVADNGTIVGLAAWGDSLYGFRDDGRTVTWYDGADATEALGVNNRGQVTVLDISVELPQSYVYTRGRVAPVEPREDAVVIAPDINNRGVAALEVLDTIDRPAIAWPVTCPGK